MSEIDWSHLDAHLLQLLVAVLETGSITAAAARLGVTQSAVSHLLGKLRAITGDPLFVKRGRGIVPTARADSLAAPARELLRQMEQFARGPQFEPARWAAQLTIAANDFQRDLLLPVVAQRLREAAPGVALRIVPSGAPGAELLRSDACQMVISPRPPDGTDILQKRLFADHYRVFYDPCMRSAPAEVADYLAADHVTVAYEAHRGLDLDRQLEERGHHRRFAVRVPGFAALPAFVRGTPLLATAPSLLSRTALAGLASAPVPVPCPQLPMYMVWHVRHQQDAAHRWLREQMEAAVGAVLPAALLGGPAAVPAQCLTQQPRGAVAHAGGVA
ncbi:LysR family transcriptional regulator [Acidovorax sp. sic0104]|uniref:LysR family transcriptional regulator n=1 Tax=Acidovorax sp. sic0104 TaxID=2854784 RepID=UPI002105E427|nr:LysR family transcriptional regulator [Acidovorax sp. sic0104]